MQPLGLLGRQPIVPPPCQLIRGQSIGLLGAGPGSQRRLLLGIGDPEPLRGSFDLLGPPREGRHEIARYPLQIPPVCVACRLVPEHVELGGEPRVVRGLEVGLLLDQVPELPRLPAGLHRIVGGVEHEAVDVQMGIRQPVHGPRREVDEVAPGEIARVPVLALAVESHSGVDRGLELDHGLGHGLAHRGHDARVSGQSMEHRDALRSVEGQVVADRAVIPRTGGESLAIAGVGVVAEACKRKPIKVAGEAEQCGGFATPEPVDIASLGVVILTCQALCEVALCIAGRGGLEDPQHGVKLPQQCPHDQRVGTK